MESNSSSSSLESLGSDQGAGRTIAVAMDDSAQSFHALNWALTTLFSASSNPNDKLLLVHARPASVTKMALGGPGYLLTSDLILSIYKSQDREIQAFMNKALQLCREKQVPAEIQIAIGDPRDVLCKLVQTTKLDMLVLGSHGHGPIKRVLMGSVSDYCARHAKCPVVVVRN